MILATLGWGCWWVHALLWRLVPGLCPPWWLTATAATAIGVLGVVLALLTVRLQRSWLVFVLVPLFANASLVAMPLLAIDFPATRS